jgi:hypothetical protein
MKDESEEDEKNALILHVNKNDRWIIDCGCSHHMTGDTSKFEKIEFIMEVVLSLVIMHHVM